jgi:hypothetical protein
MFVTRAAGYSRTFYLVAVLTWTGAVALLFITAVWGGFYGMMEAMMSAREAKHLAQSLPEQPYPAPGAPVPPPANPFEQSQALQVSKTPAGWVVSETEKGLQHLELRLEKLSRNELAPDRPVAPSPAAISNTVTGAVKPEPARPEPKRPEPAREQSGQPLMQGELGVIKSAKFEPGDGRFLMTLATTAPPDKVSFFYLDNPRRLAVNLQGAWRNLAPRETTFPSGPIARAAVGEHPDYVRVTLHFRDANAPKPADPVVTKLKDALGVSLTTK